MTLKEKLKKFFDNADSEVLNDFFFDEFSWSAEVPKELADAGIVFDLVDEYGGEGEGDRFDKTYKFSDGSSDVFIKFWGWYASYDGATYENWHFVTPKQKTVTVYD